MSIWHNVARDQAGPAHRSAGRVHPQRPDGARLHLPGHAARAPPGGDRRGLVRRVHDHPRDDETSRLSRLYYQLRLRSLSFPEDGRVAAGDVAFIVASCGGSWASAAMSLAGMPTATKPLAGLCDAARCPQATIYRQHREVWTACVTTTETFLGNPRIPAG